MEVKMEVKSCGTVKKQSHGKKVTYTCAHMSFHLISWVSYGISCFHQFSLVFMCFHLFSCAPTCFHVFALIFTCFHVFSWVFSSAFTYFHEFHMVFHAFISFHVLSLVLMKARVGTCSCTYFHVLSRIFMSFHMFW